MPREKGGDRETSGQEDKWTKEPASGSAGEGWSVRQVSG